MPYLRSYKRLNRLIQSESLEPMLSWGLRMALAGTLPLIWGLATGRIADAVWITLAAEAVSWIELKGAFSWRLRTLLAGAALGISCGILGALTGGNVWLSVACMLVLGFVATLLKNIGDRASGLGLCVYFLFIICNAYPAAHYADLAHRVGLLAIGAAWPVAVGVAISACMPAQEPFRRQIALIWRAIAELTGAVSQSDNRPGYTGKLANVYMKEKEVRNAIDSSFQFYTQMAHQASTTDNQQYQLVQLRKISGMVAINVIAMGDEMVHVPVHELDKTLRVKAATLFSALQEASSRISIFVITLRPEEKLLASSQINRLKKLTAIIRDYPMPPGGQAAGAIARILQLTGRSIRLLESALLRIDQMGSDKPVFRSYSFIKTLFVLRPRYLLTNVRVLFNFNTHTFRYALRSAIAAAFALFIYKWFRIDHGYWLPFSVMIIIQPYFGATFKRALDRVAGTLLGGVAGSLLLYLPASLHVNEAILFLTFILMVYYLRRNYAVAAFIITLNLVLLFNIESAYSIMLMVTRAICTIGGALLAVGAGWLLLPTWDKKWLPTHLADAVNANYEYFLATFYPPVPITNWTRCKRIAESKSSNVFDSFNRYLQEPGSEKTDEYYGLITCNVRITRNLNNIHLEQEEKKAAPAAILPIAGHQGRIDQCLALFSEVEQRLARLDHHIAAKIPAVNPDVTAPFPLNEAQLLSLEKIMVELKTMKQEIA